MPHEDAMLIESTCPICREEIIGSGQRCVRCRSIIQFTLDLPRFARDDVAEELVQRAIDRARVDIMANSRDGLARYVLAISYANLELIAAALEELRVAAELLPEKNMIRFELAILCAVMGRYAEGAQHVQQARALAPENRDYLYLELYLKALAAVARGEQRAAVMHQIAAHEVLPDRPEAAQWLRDFVGRWRSKLVEPIARRLTAVGPRDADYLRLLHRDPVADLPNLPVEPRKPSDLGQWSMAIIRRMSPARATELEAMHEKRLAQYEQESARHRIAFESIRRQRDEARNVWQAQVDRIHTDLPAMARLCLAVLEEEERVQAEEVRRLAEAEQRRQDAEARRRATQAGARPVTSRGTAGTASKQRPVREKRIFSTRARYLQGLPHGKAKDRVEIAVTNLRIRIKHPGMLGGWEYEIPIDQVMHISGERIRHVFSSEKRLNLGFNGAHGGSSQASFTDLDVDKCIRKIQEAQRR
jgi:tetratricopeptide (TPR) repeat protein